MSGYGQLFCIINKALAKSANGQLYGLNKALPGLYMFNSMI